MQLDFISKCSFSISKKAQKIEMVAKLSVWRVFFLLPVWMIDYPGTWVTEGHKHKIMSWGEGALCETPTVCWTSSYSLIESREKPSKVGKIDTSCFADEPSREVSRVECNRVQVRVLSTWLWCLRFPFSTALWGMSQGPRGEDRWSDGVPGEEDDGVSGPESLIRPWWEHRNDWWPGGVSWDRDKQKLDILWKVKAKLPPHSEGWRSSKASPFHLPSVNDSYVLLYAKIQLFFCCALISLNNWDPERLCHHPANSEKCEKQWESVAVT